MRSRGGMCAALFLCMAGLSGSGKGAPLPAAIAVAATQALLLEARAEGVQVYACKARMGDRTSLEWTLVAPEADLLDATGRKIGRHGSGPSWELDDGSRVVGKVLAREDAPDPAAVAWLLLGVKESAARGILARTDKIQRVDTSGGKPPGSHCDKFQENREFRSPYRATYRFYGPPN